jgi:hypothetical protein
VVCSCETFTLGIDKNTMTSFVRYWIDGLHFSYIRYFVRLQTHSPQQNQLHRNIHEFVLNANTNSVPLYFGPAARSCRGWTHDDNRMSSLFAHLSVSMDFRMKLGTFTSTTTTSEALEKVNLDRCCAVEAVFNRTVWLIRREIHGKLWGGIRTVHITRVAWSFISSR